MKKNYLLLVAAGLACLVLSCNKNTEMIGEEDVVLQQPTETIYITAKESEEDTKGSIGGGTGAFSWNTNDQIAVWADAWKVSDPLPAGQDGFATASFEFSTNPVENTKRANFAVFPAHLVYDYDGSAIYTNSASNYTAASLYVNLPDTYTLAKVRNNVTPCPMIAANGKDVDLAFSQLCALLRVKVNSVPNSASYLVFDFDGKKVSGAFELTGVVPGTTTIATSADASHDTITITDLDNDDWLDGLVVNIPVPTGTYGNVTVTAYNSSDVAVLTVTRPIKLNESWAPARRAARSIVASLPAFSISETQRVVIAQSNLQYTRAAGLAGTAWAAGQGTWSFMDYPWSRVETGSSVSAEYADETAIGLFGWGTSGNNTWGVGTYGANVYPWNTGTTNTDYGPATAGTDLTGTFANGDWGIKARTDLADGYAWRTPTCPEFTYLLGSNNYASPYSATSMIRIDNVQNNKRASMWGCGRVNGVAGCIILPDLFVDPKPNSHADFIGEVKINDVASKNNYTATEWAVMQAAGAVFLPSCGFRSGGTNLNYITDCAWYNTVTANHTASGGGPFAGYTESMQVYSNLVRIYSYNNETGLSVRLVRDIE